MLKLPTLNHRPLRASVIVLYFLLSCFKTLSFGAGLNPRYPAQRHESRGLLSYLNMHVSFLLSGPCSEIPRSWPSAAFAECCRVLVDDSLFFAKLVQVRGYQIPAHSWPDSSTATASQSPGFGSCSGLKFSNFQAFLSVASA